MNRTMNRVFGRNRLNKGALPRSLFRTVGYTPSWLMSSRLLSGHDPMTGVKISDTKLNHAVMKANTDAIQRHDNPVKEFDEAKETEKLIELFDIDRMSKIK